jgi:hypothetical protein
MVDRKVVKYQLAAIDEDLPFWVRPELKELPRIMVKDEVIQGVVNGRYQGGFALLCVTNHRILIIDKKPLFLAVEDIRYDMISEVNYTHQLFDSSIHFASLNKELWFSSFRKGQLRQITDFIQHKLSEIRNGSDGQQSALQRLVAEDQNISQEQARELLPNTQQSWDRVSTKLDRINNFPSPTYIRRRVAKFSAYQ